MQVGSLLVS
jgi:hypothetical protein